MSTDYYRRLWVTDMANRTANTPLNTVTHKQWLEEWKQMLVPGTYERGIYGDLMLPGISCGVRKILLIFNTNPNTPHDPIYIIDPSEYNVHPDSDIPILLSYNMSHYENLEPLEDEDIILTMNLVTEYKAGRYIYGREDIHKLISLESNSYDKHRNTDCESYLTRSKKMKLETQTKRQYEEIHAQKEERNFKNRNVNVDESVSSMNIDDLGPTKRKQNMKKNKDIQESDKIPDKAKESDLDKGNLFFRYRNIKKEFLVKEAEGNLENNNCDRLILLIPYYNSFIY